MGIQCLKTHSLSLDMIMRNEVHRSFSHGFLWFETNRPEVFQRLLPNIPNLRNRKYRLLTFKTIHTTDSLRFETEHNGDTEEITQKFSSFLLH